MFIMLKVSLLAEIHELLATLRGVMANQLASCDSSFLEEFYQGVFPVISVEVHLFHGLCSCGYLWAMLLIWAAAACCRPARSCSAPISSV